MIFKKLKLKNFMSYSEAEIDFSGIHVACLVGQNGAGKSSLLDAITWVLWEEGRGKTDELIKLGKDEMSCELEFFIESELYRVYRSRSRAFKNSQGKSNLEFQIFNSKDKQWILLSMSSVRQTQELIIKTVKMDYGTFVNSVYLRQGKADEFTVKKPNERKQILADVLGLETYDKLSDAAHTKVRELEQSISVGQGLIVTLEEKVLKEVAIRSNLDETNKELDCKNSNLKTTREKLSLKEKELNEKQEKQKQIQTLKQTKQSQESLIKTLEEQLLGIGTREEKSNQLIKNKNQIEQEYKNYLSEKKELDVFEQKQEQHSKLLFEKNNLEKEWKEKIKETEQELAIYRSKINDRNSLKVSLQTSLQDEGVFESFLSNVEGEIKIFRELKESLLKIETDGLDLKHKKEMLTLELNKLSEKEADTKKKIETLSSHNHSEPCPLCKSPIKEKQKVIELYVSELKSIEKEKNKLSSSAELSEKEIQAKRNEFVEFKSKADDIAKKLSAFLLELSRIKRSKINMNQFEKQDNSKMVAFVESQVEIVKSEFDKTKSDLLILDKEISSFEQQAKSLDALLKSGEFVKEISARLKSVSSTLDALQYNSEAHAQLKNCLKEKENIILVYSSLSQAEIDIKSLNMEKENLTLKIKSGHEELNKLEFHIKDALEKVNNINSLSIEVKVLRDKETSEDSEANAVKKQQIMLEQNLFEIEEAKKLLQEKKSNIQKVLDDKRHFEILEKAFSKNGIQAALIETIVPEIEKEANKILTRLTDNQMHVALKTQREKKTTSGMVETLDIVIADDLGSRNYELYSGGEAFKVDFSLRLALSRLLANRASAKLQTLIIDEGFGSQDTSGRERLIEVIKSIENEFELILVVTHIDELKESFPVQLYVTKDDEGSKVRLLA